MASPTEPPGSRAATIAELIAEDYYGRGALDLKSRGLALRDPWRDLPEVEAVDRLRTFGGGQTDRAMRLFLTFIAAMERARDSAQLWRAGAKLYEDSPKFFDPRHVAGLAVDELRRALRDTRVSRWHRDDSSGWHRIATILSSGDSSPVSRVINAGRGEAQELLRAVDCFPLLRGPKIRPMWVRMMASPGRARVAGIEIVPVAVDVQVRRATENLGVTSTRDLPLAQAKPVIQKAWKDAVSEAEVVGPHGIEGTCGALDPALWFFGKHGCGHCERAERRLQFGRACGFCVRFG